jgi:hypothetical protein
VALRCAFVCKDSGAPVGVLHLLDCFRIPSARISWVLGPWCCAAVLVFAAVCWVMAGRCFSSGCLGCFLHSHGSSVRAEHSPLPFGYLLHLHGSSVTGGCLMSEHSYAGCYVMSCGVDGGIRVTSRLISGLCCCCSNSHQNSTVLVHDSSLSLDVALRAV